MGEGVFFFWKLEEKLLIVGSGVGGFGCGVDWG